jgi:hypothetical protein
MRNFSSLSKFTSQRFVWQQAAFGQQNPKQVSENPTEGQEQKEPITLQSLMGKNQAAKENLTSIYEKSLKRGETFKANAEKENKAEVQETSVDKQTNVSLGINIGKGVVNEKQQ